MPENQISLENRVKKLEIEVAAIKISAGEQNSGNTQSIPDALPDAACFMASISGLGGSICDYLLDKGIRAVSIYGVDKIATMVWEQVFHADIQIKYTISDKSREFRVVLPIPGKIKFDSLDSIIDAEMEVPVIVCVPMRAELKKSLLKISNHILPLTDLMGYAYGKRSLIDPMEDLIRKNPQVRFVLYRPLTIENVETSSEHKKFILSNYNSFRERKAMGDKIYNMLGYSQEYRNQCTGPIMSVVMKGGVPFLDDRKSQYVNCVNGYRLTTDTPEDVEYTVYMFGNSIFYGKGTDDANTISSALQRELNGYYNGRSPYSVLNCANGGAINTMAMTKSLKYHRYSEKDIIICSLHLNQLQMEIYKDRFIICDAPYYINKLDNLDEYGYCSADQFFVDKVHMHSIGYRECAKAIMDTLKTNGLLETDGASAPAAKVDIQVSDFAKESMLSLSLEETAQLEAYLEGLRPLAAKTTGKVGSIVMNCNPFTLGHRYLIEYAASKVDRLYVFVVEEDLSIFPFTDRLTLVKEGIRDLQNVTVIPSGKFIISQTTFQAYFKKDEQKDAIIDASEDVTIFAEKIAPVLHIGVRFAGEEPLDPVTRQYNSTMKRIFPRYGIEFVVIPRKEFDGKPISASRVRKLLEDKQFEEIAEIVPGSTLEYLLGKYNQ